MISKIEAGKIEFNPEDISLISFVNEIIQKAYSPWKDNRTLNLLVRGSERIFPFDVKMLRHILQNLIENAFKYSPNKPAPQLRLRYSQSYITFSVIDSGIGIHPDDIQKLFSSFSRGRNVGSISGSGIGLVVVKYFVDQHKGSISIKSKLNVGTIFSVRIPF
jgi:signal transduction histidine kinase